MKTWVMLPMAAVLAISVAASGCAKNQSDRRAASPTMTERFKQEMVSGKVNAIGANHLSIQERNGNTLRVVRVDDQTKMDRVVIGDQVKAYVSEDGYASTVQRVAE